ncbi:MAG: hypothetical protein Q8R30_03680 [bacterium]|nr:hypothetical protein [bacterium]MDZ4260510.1 hypothetical protein [Candidatus Sungbacteria bacterium]
MEPKNSLDGGSQYSLKKLYTRWLPGVFILSVLISIFYIFNYGDVAYVSSGFSIGKEGFWATIILVFFSALGASNGLIIVVLVCSLVHLLLVEAVSITRLLKSRNREKNGNLKMLPRFLAVQAIGAGTLLVSFLLLFVVSLGISFAYGYGDLKMSVKEAAIGSVANDEEIIKLIQGSPSVIEIYSSAGEFGVVLAHRGLKEKDALTTYEGVVLPLLAQFAGKDPEGRSFFIPSAHSIVYTNFTKDKTDKIIIELAFNRIKNHSNPVISSRFEKTRKPTVTYLDDQAYNPYLKKKSDEIYRKTDQVNQKTLSDFKGLISSNEKIVSECKSTVAANAKIINDQESDYRQNCVVKVEYSNCSEFRQQNDENKKTSQEAVSACDENKIVLDSQYKEFEQLKADIEKIASVIAPEEVGELTSGLYFANTKDIYMRVAPDEDAFSYLVTLLHEVFHHYSGGGSELPVFINEGITDYLTYKSFMFSDYEIADVSGYFKEVQAVMALLEKIPESELVAAYLANNPAMVEALFKKYFPEVDYKIFLSKGEAMYRETYEEVGPTFDLGFWDTSLDHPSVRDIRTFLGLKPSQFYTNLY